MRGQQEQPVDLLVLLLERQNGDVAHLPLLVDLEAPAPRHQVLLLRLLANIHDDDLALVCADYQLL